ncbi:ATP cone domain-containing protein [Micromonospora zhanjiangensis]
MDSRMCEGERVRKRRCDKCTRTHTTAERISAEWMKVRKRNDTVERFVRAKIAESIRTAAGGTPLSPADVKTFVDRVVQVLQPDAPDVPVHSRDIGKLVMEQLRGDTAAVDVVRIRYAMVFLGSRVYPGGFRDIAAFVRWLDQEYGSPRVTAAPEGPTSVIKRDGRTETFQPGKILAGVRQAAAGRGTPAEVDQLARRVTDEVGTRLAGQGVVTSQQIGAEAIHALRAIDPIAYLRYAAAVKGYRSVDDYWLDATALLESAG